MSRKYTGARLEYLDLVLERLLKVGDEVGGVFDADGVADEGFGDAGGGAFGRRGFYVAGGGGRSGDGFNGAEIGGEVGIA